MANLVVRSRGGFIPHKHQLEIPASVIVNPPEDGILLDTNFAYSLVYKHKHQVRLTREELERIQAGETVVAHDTDKGRHSFAIGEYSADTLGS